MSKSSQKTRRTKVRDNVPIKCGKKAEYVPEVAGMVTRCPRCGSTARSKYVAVRSLAMNGTAPDGQPYTHIVWRRTQCQNEACGQHRTDRFLENRVK